MQMQTHGTAQTPKGKNAWLVLRVSSFHQLGPVCAQAAQLAKPARWGAAHARTVLWAAFQCLGDFAVVARWEHMDENRIQGTGKLFFVLLVDWWDVWYMQTVT